MNNTIHLTVPADEAGIRLDVWLTRQMTGISRSRIQSLIQAGHITLNGQSIKEHRKVRAGDCVRVVIPPPEDTTLHAEVIPLDILYQDADIIVINKPAGMVVHPAPGHGSGTLVNALLYHCPDLAGIGGERRPGIVHRLDKDTSGALVAAKNDRAMTELIAQFKAKQVEKNYLALIWGRLTPPSGTVETLIGRHVKDRKRMSVRPRKGRPALTTYETLEVFNEMSLLRIRIITGRTHQIRVHMAYLDHPVVGDTQYGRQPDQAIPVPARRQMLHAERLVLNHPTTGQKMAFTAPLPPDMADLLAILRPPHHK